jgi:hypothetical protein
MPPPFGAHSAQLIAPRCAGVHVATIQRIVSPLTGDVTYRAQVRKKGRSAESATFPNRKEAKEWASSIEAAIRQNRYFPHAAAKRTSFDALAEDYMATVLAEFDAKEQATRERQLKWWSEQFSGLSLADITTDRVSTAAWHQGPMGAMLFPS